MNQKGGSCTAVALYEIDVEHATKPENLKSLFAYFEKWFIQNKLEPSRMSVAGENLPKSKKTRSFQHCKKLLNENNFEGVDYFWIGHPGKDAKSDFIDSLLSAAFFSSPETKDNDFIFYFHEEIIENNWAYVEEMIADVFPFLRPAYGIGFQRDLDKAPDMYARGLEYNAAGAETNEFQMREDKHNTECWWRRNWEEPAYQLGDLRDIYPINLLSEEHLSRNVLDMSLRQWIQSSKDHGVLEKFEGSTWLWRVKENQIQYIRDSFRETDLVLCLRNPM